MHMKTQNEGKSRSLSTLYMVPINEYTHQYTRPPTHTHTHTHAHTHTYIYIRIYEQRYKNIDLMHLITFGYFCLPSVH